jgi:hypothetical protein
MSYRALFGSQFRGSLHRKIQQRMLPKELEQDSTKGSARRSAFLRRSLYSLSLLLNRSVVTKAATRLLSSGLIQEIPWEVRSSAPFRGSTTMRAVHCDQADSSPSEFPTVP